MGLFQRIDRYLATTATHIGVLAARAVLRQPDVRRRLDLLVESHFDALRVASANPLHRAGRKAYSQNDEDGIIAEILRRLDLTHGTFVEFGIGDGLENNTLALLMAGWNGVWIGGEALAFRVPDGSRRLAFTQAWITAENCTSLMRDALARLGAAQADVLSVDLDGNDLHIVRTLLEAGARPSLFIAEYNGKFPPPVRFTVPYDAAFNWDGSDYFGASLQAFVDIFATHGYRLVCCNITGLNAFFVPEAHARRFADVPTDIAALYVAPRYFGYGQAGHPPSARTVEAMLAAS